MKWTRCQDGEERMTLRVSLRLTRDEVADLKRLAKAAASPWREWIEGHARLGVEQALMETDGEYEQRYGKGDA